MLVQFVFYDSVLFCCWTLNSLSIFTPATNMKQHNILFQPGLVAIVLILSSQLTEISCSSSTTVATVTRTEIWCGTECWNGATCYWNAVSSQFACFCPPGFTDIDCSKDIDDCAIYPCGVFGDCTDGVNEYSCTCNTGFQRVNSTYCSDIDECSSSPCLNGATCINDIGRYKCQCPATPDNTTFYVGTRCENLTRIEVRPMITNIHPKVGMIAGGGNITITGQRLNVYPFLGANFTHPDKPTLYGYAIPELSKEDSVVVISPRADDSYINKPLSIIVDYSGPPPKQSQLIFKYAENPGINDLQPRQQLVTGKVQLTVAGTNLDVISNPQMTVTASYYVGVNRTFNGTTQFDISPCQGQNSSYMYCRMPTLELPDKFLTGNNNDTRRDGTALVTLRNGSDIANIYIGFTLDNLPTYKNISKSNPRINFTLVQLKVDFGKPPDKPVEFDPKKDPHLYLKGSGLIYGCSRDDYRLTVGPGNCTIDSLTNSEIVCTPPATRPVGADNDTNFYCPSSTDSLALMAEISSSRRHVSCVTYPPEKNLPVKLIIGVAAGVGGGLLLLIIIVIIIIAVIVTKKRKRTKERSKRIGPNVEISLPFTESEDYRRTIPGEGEEDPSRTFAPINIQESNPYTSEPSTTLRRQVSQHDGSRIKSIFPDDNYGTVVPPFNIQESNPYTPEPSTSARRQVSQHDGSRIKSIFPNDNYGFDFAGSSPLNIDDDGELYGNYAEESFRKVNRVPTSSTAAAAAAAVDDDDDELYVNRSEMNIGRPSSYLGCIEDEEFYINYDPDKIKSAGQDSIQLMNLSHQRQTNSANIAADVDGLNNARVKSIYPSDW